MKNGKYIDNRASSFPFYSNRKLLVVISALIVLMVTDIALFRIYDIISKQSFPFIQRNSLCYDSIACLVAKYLLEFIKPSPT